MIHEVANGLMKQDEAVRPALAVLPVGSGNDFAQTLGIDDFSGKDFGALLTCELQRQDIGRIRSWNPANGSGEATVEYYDQTLSVASMPPSAWAPPSCAKRRASLALRSTPSRVWSSLVCATATTP